MKVSISHRINFVLLTLFFLFSNKVSAQSPSFAVNSPTQCFSNGSATVSAVITNTVAGATSYSWIVVGPCTPTITTIGNGTLVNVSYACCGSYTYVCMAMNASTLIASAFTVAIVYCSPTVQISGPAVLCSGLSTTLQASGATTYTWFPGNIVSTSIAISPTVATTYTLVGDSANCNATAVTTVSVALPPNLTITASNNTICAGTTLTLTASGASSYTWAGGPPSPLYTITPLSSASYTVFGTSAFGCSSSAVTSISVSTPGFINILSTHSFVCPGQSATLTAAGASNYTWTNGPSTSSYVVYPTTSTGYTVTGYAGACLITATAFIIVNPIPSIAIQPANTQTLCLGATTTITASGAQSYTWSLGSMTNNLALTVTASVNFYVVGSNSSGCVDTAFVSLSVIPFISPGFTYSQGANGQVNFINTSTNTLSSTSYSWNFGNGQGSALNSPATTYSANGVYTVTLTANNGCGPVTVTHTLLVSSISAGCAASFTSSGFGGNYSFTNTSTGTTSNTIYYWNLGNGTTYSAGPNPPPQTYLSGNYTVSLHIMSTNPFCSDTATKIIYVCSEHAQFTMVALSNNTYSFSSTSTGTSASTTFSWNFGGGATATGSTSIHTYSAAGIYSVYLTAKNTSSCASTLVQTLSIAACSLSSNFTHTLTTNGVVNFGNTSSFSSSIPVNQQWDFGDGTYSFLSNPTHTFYNAGTYNVTLILQDSSSFCKDTLTQSINVTGISCVAYSNFTLLPTNTPQYWDAVPGYPWNVTAAEWSWGDGSTSTGLYSSHTYSAAGNYSICLSVTVSCGSSSSYCYSYYVNKSSDESSQLVHINVQAPEKTNGLTALTTKAFAFTIYPNPNNGEFSIHLSELNKDKLTVSVYSLLGELVYFSDEAENTEIKIIALPELTNGIYFVRLSSGTSARTEKIIISK
ncbi:hypothetical protein CNR22_08660 [Sphingobacteriaceae bacterium]|nr:hypothetical protein CNR22_08660 [Sphingobacteriaceae bacterium]